MKLVIVLLIVGLIIVSGIVIVSSLTSQQQQQINQVNEARVKSEGCLAVSPFMMDKRFLNTYKFKIDSRFTKCPNPNIWIVKP